MSFSLFLNSTFFLPIFVQLVENFRPRAMAGNMKILLYQYVLVNFWLHQADIAIRRLCTYLAKGGYFKDERSLGGGGSAKCGQY